MNERGAMRGYEDFLREKRMLVKPEGIEASADEVHDMLFPFQADLTAWALRKGRAAIFADTGLGKTFMQLEWARLLNEPTLIIAPLTVARQTVREAQKIDVDVHYSRGQGEPNQKLTITNYEMIDHFDPDQYGAVVLDESSILKSLDGKTRRKLTEMFSDTPYRLCCTATPAPNDYAELGNHAEFLGVMTRADMLSSFFVHDDNGWRMKGHAEDAFYRWLASWGMSVRKPSDLGYGDDGFILPELSIDPVWVDAGDAPSGQLFFTGLKGLRHRQQIRRDTIDERVAKAAELAKSDGQWLFWCGLNDEADKLVKQIPDAIQASGSDSPESKAETLEAFQEGEVRVLVTKPRIAGFGMNFQNCHQMGFVGLSDSWEAYYQCIRRCWRFGQDKPVAAYLVLSEWEAEIYQNVMQKEKRAKQLSAKLISHVQKYEREELGEMPHENWQYQKDMIDKDGYTLMLGDSAERLAEIEDESVGLSVFSPPFLSLYTYTPTERDIGNSQTREEFFGHFGFIMDGLHRVTMPGRNVCCHVSQVPAMLVHDGYIGMKDFRGQTIEAFEERGFTYHGEVVIDKDPQAQAIRTHAKGLAFKQLKKDASWMRPALADYILIFRKPGENAKPIRPDVDNDTWIEWARPVWYGIKEGNTLNKAEAREEDDERHICPLQLGTIERCIRLWSNKGDLVCDPFMGIGSTGYVAVQHDRQFVGIELKESYYKTAKLNMQRACRASESTPLFAV